jgi:DMSO/TMAO reductase YedYZ molybdopterin-dependent catalytic subunit
MFAMDQNKTQEERVLAPEDAGAGAIVSPDTKRVNRVPPGQSRTRKWPILDTSGAPPISLDRWRFSIGGLVANPKEWDWQEFQQLERVKVFADFHCVTHWSRLGNTWEGVSTRKLVELAGSALPDAAYVLARGYDTGFSTNVPLADFLAEDALVAFLHDGRPPHGGTRLAGAADRAATVCLEERKMDRGVGTAGPRPSGILGTKRVPHAWRSVEGRTFWLVMY